MKVDQYWPFRSSRFFSFPAVTSINIGRHVDGEVFIHHWLRRWVLVPQDKPTSTRGVGVVEVYHNRAGAVEPMSTIWTEDLALGRRHQVRWLHIVIPDGCVAPWENRVCGGWGYPLVSIVLRCTSSNMMCLLSLVLRLHVEFSLSIHSTASPSIDPPADPYISVINLYQHLDTFVPVCTMCGPCLSSLILCQASSSISFIGAKNKCLALLTLAQSTHDTYLAQCKLSH